MSCGDFDARALKREAQSKNIWIPNYLKRWINIKKVFPVHLFDKRNEVPDFSNPDTIYNQRPTVKGMNDMLKFVCLNFLGRPHSGIDDSKNIAKIAIELLKKDGFEFNQGMVIEEPFATE